MRKPMNDAVDHQQKIMGQGSPHGGKIDWPAKMIIYLMLFVAPVVYFVLFIIGLFTK
ncbi:hypothetical protein H0266_15380 [Halobacillus locisalis]|uniref:Uncharacterized protein n=1 Tax=Halobacillus locisalis TaxID=220753 RepID=A0A838CWR6_9BACI|nr:hypothetical protein [Halobacillus locisalis]MBA2176279.1 hypothetical protein [Halobacillus locisalis]